MSFLHISMADSMKVFPELRPKTATLQKQTKLRNCLPRGQRTLDFLISICPVFSSYICRRGRRGAQFLKPMISYTVLSLYTLGIMIL